MEIQQNQPRPTRETRRRFITSAGIVAAGAITVTPWNATLSETEDLENNNPNTWPWPYSELDPDRVAQRGYAGYYEGGCSFGAAKAIIGQWAEQVGSPFNAIPLEMFRYGEGGVTGWGSLCGAINSAAAAINLVCETDDYRSLINELVAWYEQATLPEFNPEDGTDFPTSVANSPLCHISVTRWCKTNDKEASSTERRERCARLTADVAHKTATLLNQRFKGEFVSLFSPAPSVSRCLSCHGPDSRNETLGKMDCALCHTSPHGSNRNRRNDDG